MASLVLKMSISLDGYVASLDGSTGWLAAGRSDDSTSWVVETVSNAGAHLIGAATYAEWAGYWPTASGPFAKAMNEIPKVVFSNSLTSADWGETEIATGDLAEAIRRLKQAALLRRIPARPGRDTLRPIACRDRLDRRVPPCHPPGRPGRGRADLHRTAHHRIGEHHRLQRRSRRPRLRRAPVIEPDRQPGSGRASSTLPRCRPSSREVAAPALDRSPTDSRSPTGALSSGRLSAGEEDRALAISGGSVSCMGDLDSQMRLPG